MGMGTNIPHTGELGTGQCCDEQLDATAVGSAATGAAGDGGGGDLMMNAGSPAGAATCDGACNARDFFCWPCSSLGFRPPVVPFSAMHCIARNLPQSRRVVLPTRNSSRPLPRPRSRMVHLTKVSSNKALDWAAVNVPVWTDCRSCAIGPSASGPNQSSGRRLLGMAASADAPMANGCWPFGCGAQAMPLPPPNSMTHCAGSPSSPSPPLHWAHNEHSSSPPAPLPRPHPPPMPTMAPLSTISFPT
eukprot:9499215-Pyramimonas_sp.AAC.1